MAILHGSWLADDQLVIWGETWRRVNLDPQGGDRLGVRPHPLAMKRRELVEWLSSAQIPRVVQQALPKEMESTPMGISFQVAVPTIADRPLYSTEDWPADSSNVVLHPWEVEGLCLSAEESLVFLRSLPLGFLQSTHSWLGRDLRFWSHVSRWGLDLLARCKFLPTLKQVEEGGWVAQWQPLLDSHSDRDRLIHFTTLMPGSCRTYQPGNSALKLDFPAPPKTLLWQFLTAMLNAEIRQTEVPPPTGKGAIAQWLQALAHPSPPLPATPDIEQLQATLSQWMAPVSHQLEGKSLFTTVFKLHSPQGKRQDWLLEYGLQCLEAPECVVDATTIWHHPVESLVYQGYTIERPQETFLAGLGLASRIFPPLEGSLHTSQPLFCRLNSLEAYEFIKTAAWRLQESGLGVILPPSLEQKEGFGHRLGLSLIAAPPAGKKSDRLSLQSLLNFRWKLTLGGQQISREEFDRLVALNSPLVEINGEWVELRSPDIRAAQEFFKKRQNQMSLSLEDALRISIGETQIIEKLPVVKFEASEKLAELITHLMEPRTIAAINPPPNFHGLLRPYQERGVGWLAFLEQWGLGACLADDMGLGKTIQLIAFLLVLKAEKRLQKPSLLVCPTSVLGNWQRELQRFSPTLKVLIHHGEKRGKGKDFLEKVQGCDLVVTSYSLVVRDEEELHEAPWQGVILDEAQNIKNAEAKQSQVVRNLKAEFRIALTGTPVENRLEELWSIMDFLNPNYLGTRQFFQRRFTTPIEKYGDTESLKTLRSLVQPFILRRLKTDRTIIEDLPEKQEMNVFCPLSEEQASLYQETVNQSLEKIEHSEGIQRHGEVLALLTHLKQICNHPDHFLKKKTLKQPERSGKLIRLREMLEEVIDVGDHALIFTQFSEWGKLLKPYLETEFSSEVLFLYGNTNRSQREEMIDRFQHDPQGPQLFILSLKAGGVGLNLTRANHVFHFDRWWNPAVENQATDRVFRIGQTRNVQVHKFICQGTVEEKINDLISSKQELATQVVGAGENWLADLDSHQLRDLLLLE